MPTGDKKTKFLMQNRSVVKYKIRVLFILKSVKSLLLSSNVCIMMGLCVLWVAAANFIKLVRCVFSMPNNPLIMFPCGEVVVSMHFFRNQCTFTLGIILMLI